MEVDADKPPSQPVLESRPRLSPTISPISTPEPATALTSPPSPHVSTTSRIRNIDALLVDNPSNQANKTSSPPAPSPSRAVPARPTPQAVPLRLSSSRNPSRPRLLLLQQRSANPLPPARAPSPPRSPLPDAAAAAAGADVPGSTSTGAYGSLTPLLDASMPAPPRLLRGSCGPAGEAGCVAPTPRTAAKMRGRAAADLGAWSAEAGDLFDWKPADWEERLRARVAASVDVVD